MSQNILIIMIALIYSFTPANAETNESKEKSESSKSENKKQSTKKAPAKAKAKEYSINSPEGRAMHEQMMQMQVMQQNLQTQHATNAPTPVKTKETAKKK